MTEQTAPRGRRSLLILGTAGVGAAAADLALPTVAAAEAAGTAARATRRPRHRDSCQHCKRPASTARHPRCATCGRCRHCAGCRHGGSKQATTKQPTKQPATKQPTTQPATQPTTTTPTTSTSGTAAPATVGGEPQAVVSSVVNDLSTLGRVITSRFSYGVTPTLAAEVLAAGGGLAWFENQISTAYETNHAAQIGNWWPELNLSAAELGSRERQGLITGMDVANSYVSREMLRRIQSPAQLLEVMTEFWTHHLYVPASGEGYFTWRSRYGDLIRSKALGRFDAMLAEAALHPAMLIYLNAATSTKKHPNENLGRELLELHTVGIGNYGEDDVKNSARILTGYRVDVGGTWAKSYSGADHWTGPVTVMGFSDPNASRDGRALAANFLRYLARHPLTARRIATKLATWFVSDEPAATLIDELAQVYLAHDTAVVPMLQYLVRHPAFAASEGKKVRDPAQDVVATHRALGTKFSKPTSASSASVVLRQHASYIGLQPYAWPTPDGPPLDEAPWATPSRALASFRVHWTLANSNHPSVDIVYRKPADWLPQLPMTVREVVTELSQRILAMDPTADLLDTVCWLTMTTPNDVITPTHSFIVKRWSLVLGLFLDHPSRYRR